MVSKYKFINVNLLQPADIILSTSSYSKDTKKIGLLTAGKYSHSALVIDPLLHFESITTGVGFSPLYIEKVEGDGNQKKWLWNISNYKHIDVYRHKDIHRNNDLAYKLIDVVYSLRGLEYPELYKLSGATGLFRGIPFIKEVLKILMRNKDKTNPGMFCSQLVKFCLDEIGYPPLLIDMDNTEVNPNHLSNKNISNLEIVENIKCNENFNIGNDEIYQKSLSHRVAGIEKRYEKLALEVKKTTEIKQQIDAVSTASSRINEITEELLDSNRKQD